MKRTVLIANMRWTDVLNAWVRLANLSAYNAIQGNYKGDSGID